MKNIILIKLGGSVITEKAKPLTPRKEVIKRLISEILEAKKKAPDTLYIVTHGSGSFGHSVAKQHNLTNDFKLSENNKFIVSAVQYSALLLHRIVMVSFLEQEGDVFSISPSSCVIQRKNKKLGFDSKVLEKALENEFIPLSFGDIIFDNNLGARILSTEELLLLFAEKLEKKYCIKKVIFVTDQDGIYKDKEKKEIYKKITLKDRKKVEENIYDISDNDMTGGMLQKLAYSYKFANKKIPVDIVNGLVMGRVQGVLEGENSIKTLIS